MQVVVAQVSHQGVRHLTVEVPEGATVAQALKVSGLHPSKDATLAIFNVTATAETVLQDGDRVEILPSLTVHPMTARRLREEKNRGMKRDLTMGRNGGRHRLFK